MSIVPVFRPYSLFLSDMHLSPHQPALFSACLSVFASSYCRQADAVYILGDLFDAWAGDAACAESQWAPACAALRDLSTQIPVYVMYGNRDFLMGKRFEHCTGVHLIREDVHVFRAYGREILLLHGDTLCTQDKRYQRFRYLMRNWIKPIAHCVPYRFKQSFARLLRRYSQKITREKPLAIQDVSIGSVLAIYAHYRVSQVIHGHTHRPCYHTYRAGQHDVWHRWVLPDWSMSAGQLSGGGLRVEADDTRFIAASTLLSSSG